MKKAAESKEIWQIWSAAKNPKLKKRAKLGLSLGCTKVSFFALCRSLSLFVLWQVAK